MKAKKISKKLLLNKQTVSHLNGNELDTAKGGLRTQLTCTICPVCPTEDLPCTYSCVPYTGCYACTDISDCTGC